MISLVVRYLQLWGTKVDFSTSLTGPHPVTLPHTPTAPHELKFSIWRDEADAALRVELAEPHTLVEGAIVDGD